jgi:uvrABC system protein B
MYADTITGSMNRAIMETERRRAIQMKYNEEHGIIPQTIKKKVRDLISISKKVEEDSSKIIKDAESMSETELKAVIKELTKKMNQAAVELNFELAAKLRDEIIELKKHLVDLTAM